MVYFSPDLISKVFEVRPIEFILIRRSEISNLWIVSTVFLEVKASSIKSSALGVATVDVYS